MTVFYIHNVITRITTFSNSVKKRKV